MSTQQAPQQPYFPPQLPPQPQAKKPWYRRWWAIVLGVLAVLMVLGNMTGSGDTSSQDNTSASQIEDTSVNTSEDNEAGTSEDTSPVKAPAKAKTPAKAKAPAKVKAPARVAVKAPEPDLTSGQENALRSAENYVSMSGFSRKGLIEQLEFEHYSTKDAAFAADRLNVDWNKEAAESAKDYVSMSGFSRSGLVEQLQFEGYTRKQAEFGADSVDSAPAEDTSANEEPGKPELTSGQANALRTAEDYISMSGFSRKGLVEQLESEGYSTKDAAFAADRLNVDWNKEAAQSAKDYVSMSGFSRSGLIEQLQFEGYTRSQAEYGADKAL
jgi:hypothetical protein